MLVAGRVRRGGGGDTGGVEAGRDGSVSDAVKAPGEYLLDDRGGVGVGFEPLQLDAPAGFVGVGCGVPVGTSW